MTTSGSPLRVFERYLTVWVFLGIAAGIALGRLFPAAFGVIGGWKVAQVNLPVAVLIWLMIVPMLLKIDFAAIGRVREHWKGIGVTLFVNWAVKPYVLNRVVGESHRVAGPSALIGASNFFELAVATAIAVFGLQSGAALATVVGVLIEVPVMLSVVQIVNRTKGWYERRWAPAVTQGA